MPAKRRAFWSIVRRLRKRFPTAFPVRVRIKPMADRFGAADLIGEDDDRHFVIWIDGRLTESLMIHFITHEWSHCLRWDHRHDQGDAAWGGHDAAWGVHYAEVFRVIYDGET